MTRDHVRWHAPRQFADEGALMVPIVRVNYMKVGRISCVSYIMIQPSDSTSSATHVQHTKFILRDLHLTLEDHVKSTIEQKADRLFRHEPRILRLRIDVEPAN